MQKKLATRLLWLVIIENVNVNENSISLPSPPFPRLMNLFPPLPLLLPNSVSEPAKTSLSCLIEFKNKKNSIRQALLPPRPVLCVDSRFSVFSEKKGKKSKEKPRLLVEERRYV